MTVEGNMKQNRMVQLDFLKILACLAVIGLHVHIRYDSLPFRALYYLCTFGVPSFFMCTGYLILDRNGFPPKYIVRKLAGIFRVAVLWSIAAGILKYAGLYLKGEQTENIFMTIGRVFYLGLQDQGVMFVMWYLGALFLIYLTLMPMGRLLHGREQSCQTKRLVLLWGLLAVLIILSRIYSLHIGRMLQNRVWLTYRLWTYWQYMLLGALLKRVQPKVADKISLPLHIGVTVILSMVCAAEFVWIKTCRIENAWASTAYDSAALMAWTASLFTLVQRLRFTGRLLRMVEVLSPLTMGVFLIHPLVMEVSGVFLHFNGPVMTEVYYILVTSVSFGLAWILGKLPFGKLFTAL